MAIAYDNSAGSFVAASNSVLSYSHTVGAALANGILVIGVVYFDKAISVSTLTYNGASCTFIRRDSNGVQNATTELWYILNPTAGANTVTITMTAASASTAILGGSISMSGTKQGAPEANTGSVVTGSHSSHSDNITTIANSAWIIDVLGDTGGPPSFVVGGSQVSRQTQFDGAQVNLGMSTLGPVTPPALTAVSWSFTGVSTATAHSVASFAPAGAVGARLFRPPSLSGLGSGGPFFHNPLN